MKKPFSLVLIFSSVVCPAFADFDKLGKASSDLESSLDFYGSSLKVVQKRFLPKTFLSSASLGLAPVLKGFNYMNSYSLDFSYRLFFNDYWSAHFKTSHYFNLIGKEGKYEVKTAGRIPLELKYPPLRSYFLGMDWQAFYGKAVFYNRAARFDLYLSLSGGAMKLLNAKKPAPSGSVALGLVCWLSKRFSARLETQGVYYRYTVFDKIKAQSDRENYFYKLYISAGVLF